MEQARILECLRALSDTSGPLWLTGGVAVDFLVGRWTRRHKDLDLVGFCELRASLEVELSARGFRLAQDGSWTTRWRFLDSSDADVEIVFVQAAEPHSGVLVIPEGDRTLARLGRYPFLPEYLDPCRTAVLDELRFRVCSPEGEWLARTRSAALVPGRTVEPKILHDLELLELLVPKARRDALAAMRA